MLTTITYFNVDKPRAYSVESGQPTVVQCGSPERMLSIHADPVEPTMRGYKGGSTRIYLKPAEAIRLAHHLLAEAHAMEHK